jgi:hypothetical protein
VVATTYTLTPEQERGLIRHAAALRTTLPEALDILLTAPPAPNRRLWTPEELQLLRNPANRPKDIARTTGRTVTAVSNRRSQLAREENIPELLRTPPAAPARKVPTPHV